MILEKQSQSLIYETGVAKDSIGMSLDLDSAQVLMQMLSKNLYSDSVGSTVRECASNALDSHRRAGVDDPIVVSFTQAIGSNNYEFSVEDFGIGLDADDVEKIISKYGKSTKRDSTTELGMMGLGFKAPLAYASSFYFVCRKNGVERKYMMYEGEEVNTIDLLYEKPTAERNGVKVIVPVSYYDRNEFREKIKEQLAYFQSVYFNVDGISNDFSIYRGENYQISELAKDSKMHICLDDVYYPIDWKRLDMREINLKMGVRFSLTDGVFPTPNRESLRYTPEAKQKIKDKIAKIADELVAKYNEDVKDSADFETVYQYYNNRTIQVVSPVNALQWLDITELSKLSTTPTKSPKLEGVNLLDVGKLINRSRYIMQDYEYRHCMRIGYRRQFNNFNSSWDREVTFNSYGKKLSERKIYLFENTVPERSKRYIKETFKEEAYFIKKTDSMKLWKTQKDSLGRTSLLTDDYSTYYGLLNLYDHPRSEWRQRIKEFQSIVDGIVAGFLDFNDIVIPEAWIIADKKARSKAKVKVDGDSYVKVKGDINCKVGTSLERYLNGQNCKFVPRIIKGSDLHVTKKLMVYAKDDERATLDKWWGICYKHVDFVILSDRELKTLETYNLSNWMSLAKFLEGKNQPYRRAVSGALIEQLRGNNLNIFGSNNSSQGISHMVRGLKEDLHDLKNHMGRNKCDHFLPIDEAEKAMEAGNVDPNIHDVYLRTKKLLSTFKFMEIIQSDRKYYRSDTYDAMFEQLCRYNNIRMSNDLYNITDGWQPVDVNGQLSLLLA